MDLDECIPQDGREKEAASASRSPNQNLQRRDGLSLPPILEDHNQVSHASQSSATAKRKSEREVRCDDRKEEVACWDWGICEKDAKNTNERQRRNERITKSDSV